MITRRALSLLLSFPLRLQSLALPLLPFLLTRAEPVPAAYHATTQCADGFTSRSNMTHSKLHRTVSLIVGILLLSGCMEPTFKNVTPSWEEANIAFLSQRPVQAEAGTLYFTYKVLLLANNGIDIAQLNGGRDVTKYQPAWSPDGTTLAITAYDDVQKSHCLMLVTAAKLDCLILDGFAPNWSPDGKLLAFSYASGTTEPAKLSVYDLATSAVKELVEVDAPRGMAIFSSWSPDGNQLAYRDASGAKDAIWLFDMRTGKKTRLTIGNGPAWSPDGKSVAFERDDDIWIHDVSTGAERVVIDDPVKALWPAWSPDGKFMLFQSFRDGNGEIYRLNLNTGELENLTNHPEWDGAPAWRPEKR